MTPSAGISPNPRHVITATAFTLAMTFTLIPSRYAFPILSAGIRSTTSIETPKSVNPAVPIELHLINNTCFISSAPLIHGVRLVGVGGGKGVREKREWGSEIRLSGLAKEEARFGSGLRRWCEPTARDFVTDG